MKRNKGVSMITLIITIIVIIILAAIAFVGMDDATSSAQYARFSSEFGDYATNFTGGAVTKVQESLGLAGKVANKAQIIYCAARGVDLSEFDEVLNGVTLPGGYTSTRFQTDIKDATGATYVLADSTTPCYEIKDDVMNEYKGKSFYGNSNGEETHWVTATGVVFTLPGYPRVVDGEERMYINAELYYVPGESGSTEEGEAAGNSYSVLLANSLVAKEPITVIDKTSGATVGNQKVTDAADHVGAGGTSGEDSGAGETQQGALLAEVVEIGDYVDYPVSYTNVADYFGNISPYTGWRVLRKEGNTVSLVSAGVPMAAYGNLSFSKFGFASYDVFNDEYVQETRGMSYEDFEYVKTYIGEAGELGRAGAPAGEFADIKYDNLFMVGEYSRSPYYYLIESSGKILYYFSDLGIVEEYSDSLEGYDYGVRVVVTLKSDVRVTATNSGDGSESNPWNLAPVE